MRTRHTRITAQAGKALITSMSEAQWMLLCLMFAFVTGAGNEVDWGLPPQWLLNIGIANGYTLPV